MASTDLNDPNRQAIEKQAVAWLARRMSGEMTAAEQREFDHWLQTSPFHATANRKMQRLWRLLPQVLVDEFELSHARNTGRLAIDGNRAADSIPLTPTLSQRERGLTRYADTRKLLGWGSGLAIAASVVWMVCLGYCSNVLRHPWADYRTLVGEQRTLQLSDGSTVYLNTDTALNVTMAAGERRIELLHGEAAFEVAHDSSRPFRVASGHATTEALGTRFVVRYTGDSGAVILLQGKVRASLDAHHGASLGTVVLNPGEQVAFDQAKLDTVAAADLSSADAWRRRRLVMNFVTLGEVVAEINRYRPGHVWLLDEDLAQRKIHVSVDIQQIDDWLKALPNTLPVKVSQLRLGHQVLLQAVKS